LRWWKDRGELSKRVLGPYDRRQREDGCVKKLVVRVELEREVEVASFNFSEERARCALFGDAQQDPVPVMPGVFVLNHVDVTLDRKLLAADAREQQLAVTDRAMLPNAR